jgi:hypothetical protein
MQRGLQAMYADLAVYIRWENLASLFADILNVIIYAMTDEIRAVMVSPTGLPASVHLKCMDAAACSWRCSVDEAHTTIANSSILTNAWRIFTLSLFSYLMIHMISSTGYNNDFLPIIDTYVTFLQVCSCTCYIHNKYF